MDIYLIRHTEVAVGRSVCYGQSDVELAHNYLEQRNRLLAHLPEKAGFYFSSPLTRCRHLAEDLVKTQLTADSSPTGITYDNRLMEYHFGDWEMIPWADIPRADLDPWMADFVNVSAPNGETFQAFFSRVVDFWQDKIVPLATDNHHPVYVITHGGVIRALLCLFLDLSLQNAYRIHLDYGAVTKVSLTGSHYTIQFINR